MIGETNRGGYNHGDTGERVSAEGPPPQHPWQNVSSFLIILAKSFSSNGFLKITEYFAKVALQTQ